jgi:hypothetical protein
MEKILAQRFDFCDFSQIVGFPNALPDRDVWEDFLPEFHAQVGRYQLSIYWTSMKLFTDTISRMRMSRLSSSGIH